MKKVIASICLFMILLVGCGGKNNNQVSNEERNANIPEVIKNSYTQIDNNIYDISKLFAVENNNIIRYKVFFDAGMIVIENKNSGYEIYPINFEEAEFSQENVCKIGRVNSIWQCDKGIATDVLIESRDYYDNTYERSVYELQEDGSIKKSVLGTYDVNEKKNISNTNNYESKYLYYYLCDDEKQIRKYNIETGYSFNGNGLAENTGKGQQTHGLYGQVDNQGNVKEIIFDYNSSEVFTYNGGLIIKNVINPLKNPITINEVRILCSVNLENEVLNMEDNKWIMKYTSVVSENGKYILFSDLNNIKDKDTTTFIIYDIKENKCIYKNIKML